MNIRVMAQNGCDVWRESSTNGQQPEPRNPGRRYRFFALSKKPSKLDWRSPGSSDLKR